MKAATTEGGVIQATIRQLTRPARACVIPPISAETALTAMFVPAAAAAFPEASRTAGSRRLPSTSPTAEPSSAATKDPANAMTRFQSTVRFYRIGARSSPRTHFRHDSDTHPAHLVPDTSHLPR